MRPLESFLLLAHTVAVVRNSLRRELQIEERKKMAHVAVEKVNESAQSQTLTNKLETMAERVRQRAYEIFAGRGTDGQAVDDWLRAERDLIFAPESEVIEKEGKIEIRVAAPGFKAAETHVTVLPDAVIVAAESTHKHEEANANVHLCEFGARNLYRRLDLPRSINVDRVTASLDDGMLRISAQKAAA
jgi:HSP20 family protein